MSAQEKVAALLGPVVAAHSLVLDDVEVSAAGKRRLVRVTVDHRPHLGEDGWIASPTPALSLDDVADVSRGINDALDASDVLGAAPYVLEVSSPGVGRRLHEPRQFQRNVGRILQCRVEDTQVSGRILRAGGDAVVIDVAGTERLLSYAALDRPQIVVEFGAVKDGDDLDDIEPDNTDADNTEIDERN